MDWVTASSTLLLIKGSRSRCCSFLVAEPQHPSQGSSLCLHIQCTTTLCPSIPQMLRGCISMVCLVCKDQLEIQNVGTTLLHLMPPSEVSCSLSFQLSFPASILGMCLTPPIQLKFYPLFLRLFPFLVLVMLTIC